MDNYLKPADIILELGKLVKIAVRLQEIKNQRTSDSIHGKWKWIKIKSERSEK